MSKIATTILFISILFITGIVHAQSDDVEQFQKQFSVAGKIPSVVLVVGWKKDAKDVAKLVDIVIAKANEAYSRLDAANPSSDVSALNSKTGQEAVKVSDEVMAAFETAIKVSEWTGGAFDITANGSGNFRDIKLNKGSSTVELKKSGMKINFDLMIEGFMAEMISRYIYTANMQNVMVKVGNIFRGIGTGLHGPWKITVEDDDGTFAHRALNLTIANTAIATITSAQYRSRKAIDPRSKEEITPPSKGVVALMNDAGEAQGMAYAAFILGPDKGIKLMQKYSKGLIVDLGGKFIRTPGF